MKMRKIVTWLLLAAMAVSLAACGNKEQQSGGQNEPSLEDDNNKGDADKTTDNTKKEDVKIAALKGPTALGMLKLLHDSEEESTPDNYEITLAGSADEILGSIIKGEFDIAAVPTNVAATLYNKTEGAVQLAALNTLGVLYVVEIGDSINSISDLAGKTIYSLGQGSTPEYALKYLLTKNGLDPEKDVTVEYKSEASEVAALMANGEAGIALLPQPFVTSLLAQNENVRVALNVTEEWNKVGEGSTLTMGCIVVQKKFAEEHPEALARFMEAYEASVKFTNGADTLETAAQYAEDFGIIAKKAVAVKAIPECNIVFKAGDEMKTIAGGFLQVMYDANPSSVGGTLPDDAFYYGVK